MTLSDVASAVSSPNTTQCIEELSIIIAAQDLTPTMMSLDFLKFSGIIAKEWELSQQPVLNPNFAQLNFTNGIGLTAQPRSISISESLGDKQLSELAIANVAEKYVEKLPHTEYVGLSLSPKILIPFPESSETARQFITGSLLGSGAWKKIGVAPIQAGVNLMYLLERCQLTINVSEARLQQAQEPSITAILFAGSFNYQVNTQENQDSRLTQILEFINSWQSDLQEFRNIVNQKFLDSGVGKTASSIGETSLFPGQTL